MSSPIKADLSHIPETKQMAMELGREKEIVEALLVGGVITVPKEKGDNITQILAERGAQYGKFEGHALVTQALKEVIQTHIADQGYVTDSTPAYQMLAPDQREALDMIANKIGRILNGNPNHADSWDDIAGYAKLVGDRLRGVSR